MTVDQDRRAGGLFAAAAVWYARAAVGAGALADRAGHAADWLDDALRHEMPLLTAELLYARAAAECVYYTAQFERYVAASRAFRTAQDVTSRKCLTRQVVCDHSGAVPSTAVAVRR